MKNKKHYLQKAIGLSLIAALFFTQSCKKSFLDAVPVSTKTAVQFWQTAADATAANAAMYADLHNYNSLAFPAIAVESMGSDDVTKGSVPTDATFMSEYINFSVTAGEGQLEGFWSGMY